MAKIRLYEVTLLEVPDEAKKGDPVTYLVEAGSQAAAWKHVASKFVIDVSIPDTARAVKLGAQGIKPETASTE